MPATQSSSSKILYQALWKSAEALRSKMDASEYKFYLLGMVFYKYLSDKLLFYVVEKFGRSTNNLQEAQEIYKEFYQEKEMEATFSREVEKEIGYFIPPALTFTSLVNQLYFGEFQLGFLEQAFKSLEHSNQVFDHLFEDIDLYSKKLGLTEQERCQTVVSIMQELSILTITGHSGDVLGDAYEYLIGQFAKEAGKKAGEFYTPQSVAKLMTQIVFYGKEKQKNLTVYDAAMGSGSLLLNVKKYNRSPETIIYYGQELNTATYNLARMNMILHGVTAENQHLYNVNSLAQDVLKRTRGTFDGILMNPPYSAHWSALPAFLQDERFSRFEVLAPKTKADFVFLLHGYHHLKETDGVMAIVLPHGVLFRGNAEGKIRRKLLEEGAIDTIIGLPTNVFSNTHIPTMVVILKKNRVDRNVLFIDASREFVKDKKQNLLTEKHIQKILQTYVERKDVQKYAHLASLEEIKENDYNLNILRYVDASEEAAPMDICEISGEIQKANAEIKQAEADFLAMLNELAVTPETQTLLEAAKGVFC